MHAIVTSSFECVEVLANIEKVDIFPWMGHAAIKGSEKDKQKITTIVKKKRAERIKLGTVSVLHQMMEYIENNDDLNLIRLLANVNGDQVNGGDNQGVTALHVACAANNRSALEKLLAVKNIDVNIQNKYSLAPFDYAFSHCSTECMERLLKDARVDIFRLADPPIEKGSKLDRDKIAKLVEEERLGRIQLGKASRLQQMVQSVRSRDNVGMIKILEQMTSDQVNECEPVLKCTALHAAYHSKNSKAVSQLLKVSNNDNVKDSLGNTPLIVAVGSCNLETIEMLLVDPRLEIDSQDIVEESIGTMAKLCGTPCTENEKEERRNSKDY